MSREELTESDTQALHEYLSMATLYESIGDIVEIELVRDGMFRLERNVRVSADTQSILNRLADKVVWSLETVTDAIEKSDESLAREVIDAKEEINEIADRIDERLIAKIATGVDVANHGEAEAATGAPPAAS